MRINAKIFFIVWLSILAAGCSSSKVNQGSILFNEGVDLFKRGDCENATLKFSNAVQRDPNLGEAYLYMASCALNKGDYRESLSLAKKAVLLIRDKEGKERLAAFFFKGGQGALKKEDYDSAILFFQEDIALDQGNDSPHLWLGEALLERGLEGDLKNTISEFKDALGKSKNSEEVLSQIREFFFERAKKYSSRGETYAESRCYLAYTENFDQNDVDAYVTLGKLMLKMGNIVGAAHFARKAYALDRKDGGVMELMDALNGPM